MPNCFQLFPKTNPSEPAILQQVDEAICANFHVDVDPKYWVAGWYNVIGFLIALKGYALGSRELRLAVVSWYDTPLYRRDEKQRREYLKDQLLILKYLEKHYTSDSWAEIGRR